MKCDPFFRGAETFFFMRKTGFLFSAGRYSGIGRVSSETAVLNLLLSSVTETLAGTFEIFE
jgi:hypothetical protein